MNAYDYHADISGNWSVHHQHGLFYTTKHGRAAKDELMKFLTEFCCVLADKITMNTFTLNKG